MSMIQTPRESGTVGTCDATAQTPSPFPTPLSPVDIEHELFELVALGDVLLTCERTHDDGGGSFGIALGMLVTRLRDVLISVEMNNAGGCDD
jgi:hypothetical protein